VPSPACRASDVDHYEERAIEVKYCAAGEDDREGELATNRWYVEAVSAAKWNVPKEVMEAWVDCVENAGQVKIYEYDRSYEGGLRMYTYIY
jgi:hypothetical protein